MSKETDPEAGNRPLAEEATPQSFEDNPIAEGSPGRQSLESYDARAAAQAEQDELPPIKLMLIPMTCIFQGYGAYVVLQHMLKTKLVPEGDKAAASAFTAATTFMHWGKLFSRVGHDIVFSFLSTRHRVYLAMALTLLGVLVPPIFVWAMGSDWVGWVFVHFGLLGVGVGVFESTFLSNISPLGKNTKAWAIMGAPLGLAIINIFCQILHSKKVLGLDAVWFYWYIAITMPVGMYVFHHYAPKQGVVVHQVNIWASLSSGGRWLFAVIPFLLAKIVSSVVMENTPGWFYVYAPPVDDPEVPLFSPSGTTSLMDKDLFFTIVYFFVLVGDAISRRIVYFFPTETRAQNVMWLMVSIACSIIGFLLQVPIIAILVWPAAFMAFWGNGMCYGVSAKYFDKFVPKEHNRAVYSLWCMLGDLGGIVGAWGVDFVNHILCPEHYKYVCPAPKKPVAEAAASVVQTIASYVM
mmetsp:Transcript_89486/g.186953  ORF Transcript_89486/g.186953 Transcript_89486/m.186953 type:complete len:465 (+) Transcript_89486:136-1530(+)|eukprot:CAMPEP_0206452066 /NCGR_PEP_ID=MMETSP0324_2-20121206/19723_1 /ASSEMBLY_ACC=CAM_ASM_000836 /TAXON_ID=2866 /ORGANISM="Crypthecodinium cohnii, Strain Seligo" /LENGTH=464 /DNA_ID=CAMNT_0053922083 /DNA_START=127 /DNA_END=1521 /DNA_ORIENTATION=+